VDDLDALLAGIVAHPHETVRWYVLADWLRDHGQPDLGDLVHFHRELIRTCLEPDEHPERAGWQTRVVQLIDSGVSVSVPRLRLPLPGGAAFEGVFIPSGSFRMGRWGSDDTMPLHVVTISTGFYLGIHPVTQEVWQAVTGTNPSRMPGERRAVEQVSHAEAELFCTRFRELTGRVARLPTEAEWEYACRAGTSTDYHWGDEPNPNRMQCGDTHGRFPPAVGIDLVGTAVGRFPPNPWGLFDCHGNVGEWCQDVYAADFYTHWPVTDPVCLGGDSGHRVCRGGAWNRSPERCRSAQRGRYPPDSRYDTLGFRVVVVPG
jgi:uncharacterized protein (TIGR02996 family)